MNDFKIGEVCEIEYLDHWSAARVYRDTPEANAEPPRLNAIGRVSQVSEQVVVLESGCYITDEHPTNKRIDHNGIVRSCIVKVTRFKEEPDDE